MIADADPVLFKSILSEMSEGVVAVNDLGEVIYCNLAACNALDFCGELKDARLDSSLAGAEVVKVINEVKMSGRAIEREVKINQLKNPRFLRLHGNILANKRTIPIFVVIHDITKIKRLEAIRRDFVANVSHELKTPLTSIRGYLETLEEMALENKGRRTAFFGRLSHNVDRLTNLVNDLLVLTKIESSENGLNIATVEMDRIVETVMNRQEGNFKKANLKNVLDFQAGSLLVKADSEGLVQIVDNLVDNAIKYTSSPGIVSVKIYKEGEFGVLVVKDTGVGIEKKYQERIFQRFYRIDKQRSQAVGSTGLGLSIVRNLIDSMNGTISLASVPGKGSTFTVKLPLALVNTVL